MHTSIELGGEVERLMQTYTHDEVALLVSLLNVQLDAPQSARVLDAAAQQRYADLVVAVHVFYGELMRLRPLLGIRPLEKLVKIAEKMQDYHERALPDVAAFVRDNPRYIQKTAK
jgi:hypothetical protein